MKRIAVISDTHNVLRPQVMEVLRGCDIIIHAGDFTSERILDELRPLASVYVVRGNNDKTWAARLLDTLRFEIDGIRFFMTHDRRDISRNLEGVDVVIFGHSHKYFQEIIDGRLWLNPGGCGRPRFSQELTMAVMTLDAPDTSEDFLSANMEIQPSESGHMCRALARICVEKIILE